MPYEFRFWVNNQLEFRGRLKSLRCIEHNKDGHRCHNKCVFSEPICWYHLLHKSHLRILPSTIQGAGKGLFCMNPNRPDNAVLFRKGQRIIYYYGEVITAHELTERYGEKTAPYGVAKANNSFEDAALMRSAGSTANMPTGNRVPNARLSRNNQNQIVLMANRDIRNRQEIFVDYGDEYILNEAGVKYETKAFR